MKKILIILTSAMLLFSFTGCGGDNSSPDKETVESDDLQRDETTESYDATDGEYMANAEVNDSAPILEAIDDLTIDENSPSLNITLTATDPDGDEIIYSVTTSDTAVGSLVSLSVKDDQLTITPVAGAYGTLTMEVIASANGKRDSIYFTLTIEKNVAECSLPYSESEPTHFYSESPQYSVEDSLYGETNVINVSSVADFRKALIDASQNGKNDKILLSNGVYNIAEDGQGSFIFADNESYSLIIEGESTKGVILDGGNLDTVLKVVSATLYINKLTIQNGSNGALESDKQVNVYNSCVINNGTGSAAIKVPKSGANIFNSLISGNRSSVVYAYSSNIKYSVIKDNITTMSNLIHAANWGLSIADSNISNNFAEDVILLARFNAKVERSYIESNKANTVLHARKPTIINSMFLNNRSSSYLVVGEHWDGSGVVEAANSSFIKNQSGIFGEDLQVVNSIFYMNNNDIEPGPDGFNLGKIKYSYIDESNVPIGVKMENNINSLSDTDFVDVSKNDYRLNSASQLIDAGVALRTPLDSDVLEEVGEFDRFMISLFDIEGIPRFLGNSIDIGPYEYVDSTTSKEIEDKVRILKYKEGVNFILTGTSGIERTFSIYSYIKDKVFTVTSLSITLNDEIQVSYPDGGISISRYAITNPLEYGTLITDDEELPLKFSDGETIRIKYEGDYKTSLIIEVKDEWGNSFKLIGKNHYI